MKSILLCFSLLLSVSVFGQYSNPYRMTYDGSNYLITNKGNGTVSKLNSSFTHSTVITGLHSPNDILYGSIGINTALVVIDSNQIKLFDPNTYAPFINIAIPGAVEAHDGLFDLLNPDTFFISDRGGDKIMRGVVGNPPFFPITYDTLASNIYRPAGMMFDDNGDIIVVSDSTNAKIYKVSTSTGAVTVLRSTSLNYLNDIARDNQGNYYITCWGDNNLYRFDDTLGSQYVTTTFNNPSGLYSNLTYDFLGLCCYNCQKVEFKYYHLFSPLADVYTCQEDSFYVDFTPAYKGIGTYEANNKFLVEVSDSFGGFTNPTVIGVDSTAIRPASIACKLDEEKYANSGHFYRIRSTHPEVTSYFIKALNINPSPKVQLSPLNPEVICTGSTLVLGENATTNRRFTWSPAINLNDSTSAQPSFNSAVSGSFDYSLHVEDTVTGCTYLDSLTILVNPELQLNKLSDSLAICLGDTTSLQVDDHPFIFNWTGIGLSDNSIANPDFYGVVSTTAFVSFSDSNNTCSGIDSVYIKVNPIPDYSFITQQPTFCENDTVVLKSYKDSIYNLVETPEWPLSFLGSGGSETYFKADSVGSHNYLTTVTDTTTGCIQEELLSVVVLNTPDSLVLSLDTSNKFYSATVFGSTDNGNLVWYVNEEDLATGQDTLHTSQLADEDTIHVEWKGFDECGAFSNQLVYEKPVNGIDERFIDFSIHPNPSTGVLKLTSSDQLHTIDVINSQGQVVFSRNVDGLEQTLNLGHLAKGLYVVRVHNSIGYGTQTIVLH